MIDVLRLMLSRLSVMTFSVSLQGSSAVSADGGGRRGPHTKSDVRLLRQVGQCWLSLRPAERWFELPLSGCHFFFHISQNMLKSK